MISPENRPINITTSDTDFTLRFYRNLCQLAVSKYRITDYRSIPWGERFLLWRHDVDFSLNRSLALSKIESEIGIKATYFLNPHSEFYNLAENSQHKIVNDILSLGHDIGLHFDAGFFGEITESELHTLVTQEADYLGCLFGVRPAVFSFHNPTAKILNFDAENYGGLLNCYSKRFKTHVSYCSDSNGYWRFRRLYDVLIDAKEPCLQVLTHPGWWQDNQMPPRQRVYRSAYGRAASTMRSYDELLELNGRINHAGQANTLSILKKTQPCRFQLCDYLWNEGEFQLLFIELWRIHEAQINRILKAHFRKVWGVPAKEINSFFSIECLGVDSCKLFGSVFNESLLNVAGIDENEYQDWYIIRNQVINASSTIKSTELEMGCVAISEIIKRLANWGRVQSFGYDGLEQLSSIGYPTLHVFTGDLTEIFDELQDDFNITYNECWIKLNNIISNLK